MKKVLFFIATCFFVSCNNNDSSQKVSSESEIQKFQNAWLNADLKNVFSTEKLSKSENLPKAYLFSKTDLIELLNTTNFNKFNFVLGLTDHNFDIKLSVLSGTEARILNSEIYSSEILESELNDLNANDFIYVSENTAINKYFLNNDVAFNQYKNFASINEISVLENTISYEGERIRQFSIGKQVIEELINKEDFSKLAVIFATNQEGKLSPIIVGLDTNNYFISNPATNNKAENGAIIIGGTQPCPNCCDINGPL